MKMICCWWMVTAAVMLRICQAQQTYVNNRQLDCYNSFNATDGFVCNAARPSCLSYLTFRPTPPYNTPAAIAYLLSSDAPSIAAANNISSDVDTIPASLSIVVVPVNCSCADGFQHHHATYRLKASTETYFSVANNTYQGLTTCQALMAANPSFDSRNLSVGLDLRIPLRCACPTPAQASSGVRFLLAYLVTWRDDVSSVAARFHLQDPDSILDANRLSSADVIFPFTILLLPLSAPPRPDLLRLLPSPPPPAAAAAPPPPPPPGPSGDKWVIVGVACGAAVLLIAAALALLFFCFLRRRRDGKTTLRPDDKIKIEIETLETETKIKTDSDHHSSMSMSSAWSRSLFAVNSLTLYTIEELRAATHSFSEANRIGGGGSSVFRGSFKGDAAAVKVMKGDVSAEINILKRINHSNIIRLSGFCVHDGSTYLVYEYADSGSLADCLRARSLTWKQRMEIAHSMADALNYLHNFADPPYVHKNLKSSNVLLDAESRPKLSNFGLARSLEDGPDLTRHVVGTHGYLAPEYIENGLITPKLDVFAFGVILSELLSGRGAIHTDTAGSGSGSGKQELLSDSIRRALKGDNVREKLRNLVDPALRLEYPLDLAFSVAQLAEVCISPDLNARPNISQVFLTLSKIRSSTNDWDPSDELDRSTSLR